MKPEALDKLPRADSGAPIVTLMTDPDMGAGGAQGFLSLVDRGANGRRIVVAKVDAKHVRKVEDATQPLEIVADTMQPPGGLTWWQRVFGGLLGLGESVAKNATTFDEAIVVPQVMDALWRAHRALEEAIIGILQDDEVTDKRAMIEVSVQQFARYVVDQFAALPVLKGDLADRGPKIAAIVTRLRAEKAAGVIAGADGATIEAARAALAQASTALEAVQKGRKPPKTDEDDDMLTAEKIALVAKAAADNAVAVAKAANPALTPVQLQVIGVEASTQVFKAAVMGPPQPGLPANALEQQVNMGGGMGGMAPDPMAAFTTALNSITSLTAKIDKIGNMVGSVFGVDLDTGKAVALKDDKSNAGLMHVVVAQGATLQSLAERVGKIAGTPAQSKGGGDQPEASAQTVAAKRAAEDATWKGSPFDLSTRDSQAGDATPK